MLRIEYKRFIPVAGGDSSWTASEHAIEGSIAEQIVPPSSLSPSYAGQDVGQGRYSSLWPLWGREQWVSNKKKMLRKQMETGTEISQITDNRMGQ